MKVRHKIRWIVLLSFFLILSAFAAARNSEAQRGIVGTQTCTDCHSTWLDNNPETADVTSGRVSLDYRPLNILFSTAPPPWYSIPEGYTGSVHNIPPSNLSLTDNVKCEGCHGSGLAHFGTGPIPVPIPDIKTCTTCHNSTITGIAFPANKFLQTSHANPNNTPSRYFDQGTNGTAQAKTSSLTPGEPPGLKLFKSGTLDPTGDPVTRNERVQECSVCHNYALNYPQFVKKIAERNVLPKPTVSCGACHDAHIAAPDGLDPAIVTSSVVVTSVVSGTTTPVSVAAVSGRAVSYLNHKPYKLNDIGAQDTINGIWTRGSAINGPQTTLIRDSGVVTTSSDGTCDLITLGVGGFIKRQVKEGDTLFISGVASATVNLPADAKLAGQAITVQATLDKETFEVVQVIDDHTVLVDTPVTESTNVTYILADGKTTKTLAVTVSFCGLSLDFEVRNMSTNTEDLCMSCHTRGTYRFTKSGKKADGSLVDLSPSHNINAGGQYKTSGHADRLAPAWEEFFINGGHDMNWPYDMSITGSGGVGSLRVKGKRTFALTSTPDNTLAYLSAKGNTTLPATTGNFACLQCHNGLSAIDYLKDVQGTSAASVVWGDATVVCITCHDPHQDQVTGKSPNLRKPVKLSYNTFFVDAVKNPRGGKNTMMDGTPIPSGAGTGIICLFCHQGRESGLTVYLNVKSKGVDPYVTPDKVISANGVSFQNPHYLESGALIWGKNAWEFLTVSGAPIPNKYSSGIPAHQAGVGSIKTNCAGCHMGEASANDFEGGHTWRPRIEVCQQCHKKPDGSPLTGFQDIKASADFDGDGVVKSAVEEIGTINDTVIGTVDSGLFGQLNAALAAKGIFYNPNTYPYFFNASGGTFTAWTSNTLTAAFNLSFLYKAGNCAYVHNIFYSAQLLVDSLKALGVTSPGYKNRPAGDRPATDYRTIVVNP